MSDSTGAEQDGATDTVDKARFDGLMSAYQREMAKSRSLESRLSQYLDQGGSIDAEAQTDDGGDAPDDSQQTAQSDGFGDGDMVIGDPPPTAGYRSIAATSGRMGDKRETTQADLRARLDAIVGKPSLGRDPWANIDGDA